MGVSKTPNSGLCLVVIIIIIVFFSVGYFFFLFLDRFSLPFSPPDWKIDIIKSFS